MADSSDHDSNPSNNGAAAVTQIDSQAFTSSVNSTLDDVQKWLKFPVNDSDDDEEDAAGAGHVATKASAALQYSFQGSLSAILNTSWELAGVLLERVSLDLAVSLASQRPYTLGIQLQAFFSVGECEFTVTGIIPNTQTQDEVEFVVSFRLADPQVSLDAQNLLKAINTDLSFETARDLAPADLKPSLVGQSRLVAGFDLTMRRTSDGQFYLCKAELALQATLNWTPSPTVQIEDVVIRALAEREGPDVPWSYELLFKGNLMVGSFALGVAAKFKVADTSSVVLTATVTKLVGLKASDVLDVLVPGTSSESVSKAQAQVPGDLDYLSDWINGGRVPIAIRLAISKPAGAAWQIDSVKLTLRMSGVTWVSPSLFDNKYQHVKLRDVYLAVNVSHVLATPSTLSIETTHHSTSTTNDGGSIVLLRTSVLAMNTVSWSCQAMLGGTIQLRDGQLSLAVLFTFDSEKSLMTIVAEIPETEYCYLSDIAGDSTFSPAGVVPTDIDELANSAPVPPGSPLQLEQITEAEGSQRNLKLVFSEHELSRVVLRASYSGHWNITDSLDITNMGILFDIENPQDRRKYSIAGYVYGTLIIGSVANIFALIEGTKDADKTSIWALFTATLDPTASLGKTPSAVISDSAMLARFAETIGWGLPSSTPIQPSDALSLPSASLCANLVKNQAGRYFIKLLRLKIQAGTDWEVFDGFKITNAFLSLTMYKGGTITQSSDYAELLGSAELKLNASTYQVDASASFVRKAEEASAFHVSLQFSKLRIAEQLTPSIVMSLQEFGGTPIPQDQLTGKVPGGYPLSSDVFIQESAYALACDALVTKGVDGKFALQSMLLTIKQNGEWRINSSLVLENASLQLLITKPKDTRRTYELSLAGTLKIGANAKVEAVIRCSNANGKERLDVAARANFTSSASQVMTGLVSSDADVSVPINCPVPTEDVKAEFSVVAQILKENNEWKLRSATLDMVATGAWAVDASHGQLIMSAVALKATFTDVGTTNYKKNVSLQGIVSWGAGSERTAVAMIAKWTNSQIVLSLASGASITLNLLLSQYATDWKTNSAMAAPDIPSDIDSSLHNYQSQVAADASLTLDKKDGSFRPTSLSVSVGTSSTFTGWTIVEGYLIVTKIQLSLELTNLADTPKLSTRLVSVLSYQGREHAFDPGSQLKNISIDMRATARDLSVIVPLSGCNLAEAVYVGTAGRFLLLRDWWPGLRQMDLYMNWYKGKGHFVATLNDWSLVGNKAILSMLSPHLSLYVSRASTRLSASGEIAGDATVFGIQIPISYELPRGPLRIWGIDVRKIYDMCKKLLELYEDVAEICEIMADIVGLSEGAEVAAALIALGCAASLVWDAVNRVFDSSSSSTKDSPDQPNQNLGDDSTTTWVLGGSGLANGTIDEAVLLDMYPRDPQGRPYSLTDVTQLKVKINSSESSSTSIVMITDGGYRASYIRPSHIGPYSLEINYSPQSYTFKTQCVVRSVKPALSNLSVLDVSHNSLAGVDNYGAIWPKDQFSAAMLGIDLHNVFTVEFVPALATPVEYEYYSDGIRFSYKPEAKEYTINAKLNGSPITNSGTKTTATNRADAKACTVSGPGACSGIASIEVAFSVTIKDQQGQLYASSTTDCQAIISSTTATVPVSLVTKVGSTITFEYTRPASSTKYDLLITVNGVLMPLCPLHLQSTATAIDIDVAKSIVTSPGPFDIGTIRDGSITVMSSLNEVWRQTGAASAFQAVFTSGTTIQDLQLVEQDPGALSFSITPVAAGNSTVAVTAKGNAAVSAKNSPITISLLAPPVLTDFHISGSVLMNIGNSDSALRIRPLDQYGRVMSGYQLDPNFIKVERTRGSPSQVTLPAVDDMRISWFQPAPADTTYDIFRLNEASMVMVVAVDAEQNRPWLGGDSVVATSSDFTIRGVVDLENGAYIISYIPSKVEGLISITLNGKPCTGSPYQASHLDAVHYAITGAGTNHAETGKESDFEVSITSGDTGNVTPYTGLPTHETALVYPVDIRYPVVSYLAVPTFTRQSPAKLVGKYTLPTDFPLGNFILRHMSNHCKRVPDFPVNVVASPPLFPSGYTVTGNDSSTGINADFEEGVIRIHSDSTAVENAEATVLLNQTVPGNASVEYKFSIAASEGRSDTAVWTELIFYGGWRLQIWYSFVSGRTVWAAPSGGLVAPYIPLPRINVGAGDQHSLSLDSVGQTVTQDGVLAFRYAGSTNTMEPLLKVKHMYKGTKVDIRLYEIKIVSG